jgi:cytochrome c peroxidase
MRTNNAAHATLVASLAVTLALAGCGSKAETPAAPATPTTPATPATATPEPLVALALPTTLDAAKVALGRRLFHDPLLSGDGTLSCSSCHSLDAGGAEHRRTSVGIRGQVGPINSPTVLNSSLNFVQFWDGRAPNLDAQAAGPIGNPGEMGSTVDAAVTALKANPEYVTLFAAAYPDGITPTNLTNAIAEYERSLITISPFDKFLGGDQSAISAQAKIGYDTFKSVGCTGCHTGQNIGGSMYQKMGLVQNYFTLRGTPLTDADNGRFNVTHAEADRHMFKVPTLRNIALTAPYFHDGSQPELHGTVKMMGHVQLGRELTEAQIADIVAFLETLTGELPAGARPLPGEIHPDGGPMIPPSTGTSNAAPANGPNSVAPAGGPSGARSDLQGISRLLRGAPGQGGSGTQGSLGVAGS